MTYRALYMKERRRIQRTIRRYIKRGLDVNITIPKIPKKITAASVRRLERITLSVIREASQGPDYETGEVLDYGRFVAQERRIAKAKKAVKQIATDYYDGGAPTASDLALDVFYADLEDYDERAKEIVESALDISIRQYGKDAVAGVISEMKESGELLTPKESYNIGAIYNMVNTLRGLLVFSPEEMKRLREIEAEDMFSEDEDWFE